MCFSHHRCSIWALTPKSISDMQISSQELNLQEWTLVNVASSRTKRLPGVKTAFTVQSCSVPTVLSCIHTLNTSDPEAEIPQVLIPSSPGGRDPGMPIHQNIPNKTKTHKQPPNELGPTTVSRHGIVRTHTKDQNCRAHHGLHLCLIISMVSTCLHEISCAYMNFQLRF